MKEIEPRLDIGDERTIDAYKQRLKEQGYNYIKKEFDSIKLLTTFDVLLFCHLLSIAAHEFRRETGKIPSSTQECCGLCLYHRSRPLESNSYTICFHPDEPDCILSERGFRGCCKEFEGRNSDNGLSLIIKLRKTFVDKYYEEDKANAIIRRIKI